MDIELLIECFHDLKIADGILNHEVGVQKVQV